MIVICDESSRNKIHMFGIKDGKINHVVYATGQLNHAVEYAGPWASLYTFKEATKQFYSYVIDKPVLREELPKELQLYMVLMEM